MRHILAMMQVRKDDFIINQHQPLVAQQRAIGARLLANLSPRRQQQQQQFAPAQRQQQGGDDDEEGEEEEDDEEEEEEEGDPRPRFRPFLPSLPPLSADLSPLPANKLSRSCS